MNDIDLRVRILLTMQVALLGFVTREMIAVLTSWGDGQVSVRILFDGEISKLNLEIVGEIESEIISHLPDHDILCSAELLGESKKISPLAGEVFVFRRADSWN